jgi:protein-disulfide isomerase
MVKPTVKTIVLFAGIVLAWAAAWAADGSSFKPPAGARVAVVVFEDLQCPSCAQAYPAVWDAANAHHIPVVLHDFPLRKHNWSFQAAVFARFFDTKSLKVGNDYRGYIYKNQNLIPDEAQLNNYTKKFAADNKIRLPPAVDPAGKLAEKVKADFDLGMKIGLQYTPTIFVVGQDSANAVTPFVEVEDRNQLSQIIEDMLKKAPAPPVKTPVKTTTAASKKKAG